MRLATPRVPPLSDGEIPGDLRERFGDGPLLNIFRTLAHHPDLFERWMVFSNHVLGKSTLPAREREIAILRVGHLRNSGYEWTQHVRIALGCGLSEEEIRRTRTGPDASEWTAAERAILKATDELVEDAFVSDATWKALTEHLNTQQSIDLVFTVGQYNLVSMALNTLGVQVEEENLRFALDD
jgi:alkylhydroperoxidase family enzyme